MEDSSQIGPRTFWPRIVGPWSVGPNCQRNFGLFGNLRFFGSILDIFFANFDFSAILGVVGNLGCYFAISCGFCNLERFSIFKFFWQFFVVGNFERFFVMLAFWAFLKILTCWGVFDILGTFLAFWASFSVLGMF